MPVSAPASPAPARKDIGYPEASKKKNGELTRMHGWQVHNHLVRKHGLFPMQSLLVSTQNLSSCHHNPPTSKTLRTAVTDVGERTSWVAVGGSPCPSQDGLVMTTNCPTSVVYNCKGHFSHALATSASTCWKAISAKTCQLLAAGTRKDGHVGGGGAESILDNHAVHPRGDNSDCQLGDGGSAFCVFP